MRYLNKGFNRRQQGIYRPMLNKAWLAHCQATGCFPNAKADKDAWYRANLMQCIGENTTARCNKAEDFDLVIRHFATLAGDDYWPIRVADSPERRFRFLIEQRLHQMGTLNGTTYSWNYALGILKHMFPNTKFAGDIANCPAPILRKVFIALDRQAARLRSRKKTTAKQGPVLILND